MRSNRVEKVAYRIAEFVQATGIGRSTVFSLIKAGKLRAVRTGNITLIPAESVNAFLAQDCGEANARALESSGV